MKNYKVKFIVGSSIHDMTTLSTTVKATDIIDAAKRATVVASRKSGVVVSIELGGKTL